MALRRLKSDRFFTDDFGSELYTEFGDQHLRKTSMMTVIRRHSPQLAGAMSGLEIAFHPWKKAAIT